VILRKLSDEVYVADEPIVRLGRFEIELIKEQARKNTRGRARICTHPGDHDPLHEMLIAMRSDTYVRPHKHVGKSESFHVIEGQADVVVFDDVGAIVDLIALGDVSSGRHLYYRLSQPSFHTLLIRSELLVLHEVTNGPFRPGDALFAPFSPAESDGAAGRAYLQDVLERVRSRNA
jgi:cupin fold WbuC family metalloprotein